MEDRFTALGLCHLDQSRASPGVDPIIPFLANQGPECDPIGPRSEESPGVPSDLIELSD
jgi:hypothetical protein